MGRVPSSAPTPARKSKEQKRLEAEQRNRLHKALKEGTDPGELTDPGLLRRYVQRLENEIEKAENKRAKLENTLADPALYDQKEAFAKTMKDFNAVNESLESLIARWEEALEKLD